MPSVAVENAKGKHGWGWVLKIRLLSGVDQFVRAPFAGARSAVGPLGMPVPPLTPDVTAEPCLAG